MGSKRFSPARPANRNFLPLGAASQFRVIPDPMTGFRNKATGSPGRNTGAVETGTAGDIKQLLSVAVPAGLDASVCGDHPLVRGISVGRGTDVDFRAAADSGHVGDRAAVGREPALAFAEFGVQEWFSLWGAGARTLQGRDPEIRFFFPFAYDVEKSAAIGREIRGGCVRGLLKNCGWFVAARMVDYAFSVRGPDWQRFRRLIKREPGGGSRGEVKNPDVGRRGGH